ncbi:MAG: cytochrome P450 [Candidatus Promineifilaceae bacterium]
MTVPQVSTIHLQKLYRQHGPAFPRRLQQTCGDLFSVQMPFLPRIYFALHPDHVYAVLSQQKPPLEKPSYMRRALTSSFGNGLFTSQGESWRRQRRLMQPAFHHAQIARYAAQMTAHTQNMLAGWQDGEVISIGDAMHALTFTIVLDALFSTDGAAANTAVVHRAVRDLGQGLAAFSRSLPLAFLPGWAPLPALRQKRRGERALAQSVQSLIAARRALGEAASPPDLLTTLLFARDTETGESMSDRQLQDELITLYIAGHDTTAILLSWAWVLLAQHEMAATKLAAELTQTLNGRPPTAADLPQLPYTQMVVKETLRLYPPAWYLFRQAEPDLTLAGEQIPDGSIIFLMPFTTQRDSRWFADPDNFQPERWRDGLEKTLPKGAYFPFGLGSRTCIGNGFALMEAQLLLATIAQQFCLEQLNEAKMDLTPTLGFAQPVLMRLHKQ